MFSSDTQANSIAIAATNFVAYEPPISDFIVDDLFDDVHALPSPDPPVIHVVDAPVTQNLSCIISRLDNLETSLFETQIEFLFILAIFLGFCLRLARHSRQKEPNVYAIEPPFEATIQKASGVV